MIVIVNGKELELANSTTADGLVKQFNYQNQRIALEVNEVIISKSAYAEFKINAGDKIEIIKAVGGG
jgi:sulfur carrier protein